MHATITDHPEYRAIRERLAAAERDRAAAIELGQRWDAEVTRLRIEHGEAVRAATEAGELPPAEPALPARPDVKAAYDRAHAARDTARREERAWLAERSAELLAELRDAERTLAKRAAPHVARLRELVPEWGEVVKTAAAVEAATGRRIETPTVTPETIVGTIITGNGLVPAPRTPAPRRADPAPERALNEHGRLADARAKHAARLAARRR
jgi:hypothetical protein